MCIEILTREMDLVWVQLVRPGACVSGPASVERILSQPEDMLSGAKGNKLRVLAAYMLNLYPQNTF